MITIRELISLDKGDVLRIDRRAANDIDLFVGNRKKFTGKPGRLGNQLAVKINNYS